MAKSVGLTDGVTFYVHLGEVPGGAAPRSYGYECLLTATNYLLLPCGRCVKLPKHLGDPEEVRLQIELAGEDAAWFDEDGRPMPRLAAR